MYILSLIIKSQERNISINQIIFKLIWFKLSKLENHITIFLGRIGKYRMYILCSDDVYVCVNMIKCIQLNYIWKLTLENVKPILCTKIYYINIIHIISTYKPPYCMPKSITHLATINIYTYCSLLFRKLWF